MRRYEVFDPSNGHAIYTTRFRLVAKVLANLCRNRRLDWGLEGDGWIG